MCVCSVFVGGMCQVKSLSHTVCEAGVLTSSWWPITNWKLSGWYQDISSSLEFRAKRRNGIDSRRSVRREHRLRRRCRCRRGRSQSVLRTFKAFIERKVHRIRKHAQRNFSVVCPTFLHPGKSTTSRYDNNYRRSILVRYNTTLSHWHTIHSVHGVGFEVS